MIAEIERKQLAAIAAWEAEQVRVIKENLMNALKDINTNLKDLFEQQPEAQAILHLGDRLAGPTSLQQQSLDVERDMKTALEKIQAVI